MRHAPPDLELIDALRRHLPGAEERFLKAYSERLFSFGMMVCGHREDAEDIAQESLMTALKAVATLRAPEAFHVWLYRIVKNACYRQRGLHRQHQPEAVPFEEMPEGGEPDTGAAWPDAMVEQEQTRQRVQAAIATLPAQDRLIVLLRDFEELSTEEVGRIMELSESAVKMRLLRARRKLRQELAPYVAVAAAAPPG